ncbi:hypothetical protein HanHA300_Chr13g0499221 [Helianthus annuus]|nr:hypothetical protein HanHA300_Chr13g0499221 [Helianthus annuus]
MTWRIKKSKLPPPLPEDFSFNKKLYADLIKEAGRIQKYPEHILVMGRISTMWAEPEWYPTLRWNKEGHYGLKEALRLKSFDSKELDIWATKTPKGDTPCLQLVQQNLYPIRDPEAPGGQGGSGSAPVALPVAQIQAVVTADDAGGRKAGSSATKGSGSKIIIEDEGIHLSVEDTETRASGEKGGDGRDEDEDEEGDDGDEGERPQISLKRKRAAPTKVDPKPKQLKRKKADFKAITLDDDDQVTEFSTAGGVLENLDAHLHEGRTPCLVVNSKSNLETRKRKQVR